MSKDLAVIMMLKNEHKYVYGENDKKPEFTMLQQQLRFLESFVDHIVISDGGSYDGSRYEYIHFDRKKDITILRQPEPFDENIILNQMLNFCREKKFKWILYLDGDEILEDSARKFIRQFMDDHDYKQEHTVRFNYINLWRSRNLYRFDKWYNSEAGKLFSLTDNLHSIGTPWNNHHFSFNENRYDGGNIYFSEKKILHYAWVDWKHILKKNMRNIDLEMEIYGKTYQQAVLAYKDTLDETGIILQPCLPEWAEEYRTGKIKYE